MAWQFNMGKQPRFNGRENTSSGKPQAPFDLANGAKQVGRVLGAGEPGKATGFRPGGYGPGYDKVGGKSGMQPKIPDYRDRPTCMRVQGVDSSGSHAEQTRSRAHEK